MTETDSESLIPKHCLGWVVREVMHPILEEAQKASLAKILDGLDDGAKHEEAERAAAIIMAHRAEVLAILSLEAPKQRKPRADRGTKRTKKIAPVTGKPAPPSPPDADPNKMEALPKYKNK